MQTQRVNLTAATAAVPTPRTDLARRVLAIVGASLFLALCAHVAVPHSFTAVPTTMQTFGVLLVGIVLGPGAGALACVLYLLEGLAGAPVFAPPISGGGMLHLLGPTGGFLLSYPIAAAVAGSARRSLQPLLGSWLSVTLAGAAALVPVFVLGLIWLSHLVPQALTTAWKTAVLPFLPGELVKLVVLTVVARGLERARSSQPGSLR